MSVASDSFKSKIENSNEEQYEKNAHSMNRSGENHSENHSNSDNDSNSSCSKSKFSHDSNHKDSYNTDSNHGSNSSNGVNTSAIGTAKLSSNLDNKIQDHESTEPSSKDTNHQDTISTRESTKEIDSSLGSCTLKVESLHVEKVEENGVEEEKLPMKEPTPEDKEQEGITKCEKDISQILPIPATLFLGARPHPPGPRLEQWLVDHGIGAVLDLTTFYSPHKRIKGTRGGELVYSPRVSPWSPRIDYKNIPVFDLATVDLYAVFKEAHDFIHENRVRAQRQAEGKEVEKGFSSLITRKKKEHVKGGVLVHCEAGMSRSPTIVISYLVRYHNMSLSQAFVYVRARRGISPNYGFALQLIRFANECRAREKKSKSRLRRLKKESQPEEPDHADFLIQIFLHRYPDLSKTREEIKNALDKHPGSFENAYAELTATEENKNSDEDGGKQIEIKETTSVTLKTSPNAYPITSTSRDTSSLPSSTTVHTATKKDKKIKK